MHYLTVLGLLLICPNGQSFELPVPERDLPPRNFNPHPFTVSPPIVADFDHPYAALLSKLSKTGGRVDSQDINQVSPYRDLGEYVRRVLGMPKRRNNAVPKQFGFTHSLGGTDHTPEYQGDSSRGQYRAILPDGRLQVVNYITDDNGYSADVVYDQQEKPIVEDVHDVPPEKDVHTRIALKSANMAKIQTVIDKAREYSDEMIKYQNRLYQAASNIPIIPSALPPTLNAFLLPTVKPAYDFASAAETTLKDIPESRARQTEHSHYFNYDVNYNNLYDPYSVSPNPIFLPNYPEVSSVASTPTVYPYIVDGRYLYDSLPLTVSR